MRVSSIRHVGWILGAYALSLNAYYVLTSGPIGRSSPMDEIFALMMSPFAFYLIWKSKGILRVIITLLFIYFVLLTISSAIELTSGKAGAPLTAVLLAVALDLKPLAFTLGILFLYEQAGETKRDLVIEYACKVMVMIGLLNSVASLINIYTGISLTTNTGLPRGNYFTYAPVGLFSHKVQLATIIAISFIASCVVFAKTGRKRYIAFAAIFSFILLSANSAKELIAIPLGALLVFMSLPRGQFGRPNALRIALALASPLIAFSAWTVVDELFFNRAELYILNNSVRGMMYETSTLIATDTFPFGSGAGTFGSSPSRDLYFSNIYHQYGLSSSYGASPVYSSYIMDTWWPKVLGEAGWIGAAAYLLAILLPLGVALRSYIRARTIANSLAWPTLALLLGSSIASAVFNSDVGMLAWAISFMTIGSIRGGSHRIPRHTCLDAPDSPQRGRINAQCPAA